MSASIQLPLAVRAYVPPSRPSRHRAQPLEDSDLVLVLDTETTTDPTQRLLFGSYRVYRHDRLWQEGLIAADDLVRDGCALLEAYVAHHPDDEGAPLRLHSRTEFVRQVLWPIGYEAHAVIVGFNLSFDLTRLAVGVARARDGGFSLRFWESVDDEGVHRPHRWRPNITIKAYASHRQFIRFTTPQKLDPENRVAGKGYRGRFADLHMGALALTDQKLSLERAAREFGLPEGKARIEGHGVITEDYISYNRQDVRLTWQLYRAIRDELARHPIDLPLEKAYSPASVSKAYLRTMGITPPLERLGDVRPATLGRYMVAYYGGRAEVRIRLTPVPVRYVDFTSMYPTVFALQGLWRWLTAHHFAERDVTPEARGFLEAASRDTMLDQAAWPALACVVCRVRPDGDLLPARAQYGRDLETGIGAPAWTIGIEHVSGSADGWWMLADLVAGKLLSGKAAEILEAIRVEPVGTLPDLRLIKLRGTVRVDPADDLFRRAIEERQRARRSSRTGDRERLAPFLKTFANGGSYGIAAEYHQQDPEGGEDGVEVHADGLWSITARVHTPEEPGEYCFAPVAASVTAGGRLLLALLEAEVEAAGGAYVGCDTDSLIIVSCRAGGLVACEGGPERLPDGRAAVRALSHAEVDAILERVNRLNPYDRSLVPSLIKLEPENVGPDDPPGEELWAVAISAKRYVLYRDGPAGRRIVKPSLHGLGSFRSPHPNPPGWDRDWPAWIEEAWSDVLASVHGETVAERAWHALPAISQITVTSPHVLAPFRSLNGGKPYAEQVKPYSFMTVGHVDPLAPLPTGVERDGLVPIAPFAVEATDALSLPWRNRRDGKALCVTTKTSGAPGAVRLTTYGDVLVQHRWHPEHKSGDPAGGPGRRTSVGLLPRLDVIADPVSVHIGKESNHLDEVEDGVIVDPDEVVVEYRDARSEWEAALPTLRRLRDERGWRFLAEASGLSERAVRYALNSAKLPRQAARTRLLRLLTAART